MIPEALVKMKYTWVSSVQPELRNVKSLHSLKSRLQVTINPGAPFYFVFNPAWYCSSLIFSDQSVNLPLSCSTMEICVIPVVAVAPCQCFTSGGIRTTSPFRISAILPPHCEIPSDPSVTIRVWPNGWVCQAVQAMGLKVTLLPDMHDDALACKKRNNAYRTREVFGWSLVRRLRTTSRGADCLRILACYDRRSTRLRSTT